MSAGVTLNMNVPVIQTVDLFKSYAVGESAIPVLRGIDMTVLPGECVFLAGPSGSGKTTLLSILGCVLTPDSGRVNVLGRDMTRLSSTEQAEFRRERIGFVFQRFHLFEALTALENVTIPLQLLRWPAAKARSRSAELLDTLGLAALRHRNITQLSMGQRQRVAVARALAADPDLILADEPTASLDEESGRTAVTVLRDLCRSLGKTVLVVTHDSRIFEFADRILFLNQGRMTSSLRVSTAGGADPDKCAVTPAKGAA